LTPLAANVLKQFRHGNVDIYAVAFFTDAPLFAQSHIAFTSACIVAYSWLSLTMLICGVFSINPLYPVDTILLSKTITQPTLRLWH